MDSFITIRFKRKTAKRFQEFSKKHFKTHTEAMENILDFFFYNEISPKKKLDQLDVPSKLSYSKESMQSSP